MHVFFPINQYHVVHLWIVLTVKLMKQKVRHIAGEVLFICVFIHQLVN